MIASAQFTIISLCDVVTSDTPPENPYEGQLWVDTSVTPPETKIWDGNEWMVQNDISNYTASCNGLSSSNTTGSALSVGKIAKSGSVTVTLTVTDSRGYTASVSQTITVIP